MPQQMGENDGARGHAASSSADGAEIADGFNYFQWLRYYQYQMLCGAAPSYATTNPPPGLTHADSDSEMRAHGQGVSMEEQLKLDRAAVDARLAGSRIHITYRTPPTNILSLD